MPYQDNPPEKAANLRRQAEEIARANQALSPVNTGSLSPEEIRTTLHELQVHQIELEMQNVELRLAQAELDAEKERYFDLFELAPVGYCTVSANGLIDKINLAAAALLGISRGNLLNQPLTRFIAKEDQDIYYLHQKQLMETAEPQAYELRMTKGDGTLWWAHLDAALTQMEDESPACRFILSDISGRIKVEQKLLTSETLFRDIYESSPIAIELYNEKGYLVQVNTACLKIFGVTEPAELQGFRLFDDPNISPEVKALLLDMKEIRYQSIFDFGKVKTLGLYHTSRSGQAYLDVVITPLNPPDENTLSGYLVQLQDITERKQADDNLLESLEKLRISYQKEKQQCQELQEEAKARGMFIDILGHELRTPLTPVTVNSAMLQDMVSSHELGIEKKLVENMFNGAQALAKRIEELLELGRFSRGTFTLHRQVVNLTDLVSKTAACFKPLAEQQSRQLILEIQDGLPVIEADPARLEQVLANLLSNAVKYSPQNTTITLTVAKTDTHIFIEVQNEGIGITPEEQKKLFDPYHRVMQDTQKYSGIGLGLAISKQIVEAHGGSISIETHSDQNTCFRVEIPVKILLEAKNKTAAG